MHALNKLLNRTPMIPAAVLVNDAHSLPRLIVARRDVRYLGHPPLQQSAQVSRTADHLELQLGSGAILMVDLQAELALRLGKSVLIEIATGSGLSTFGGQIALRWPASKRGVR